MMRISMRSVVVTKEYRRRLAIQKNPESSPETLATREVVRNHLEWAGESEDSDIWLDTEEQYQAEQKEEENDV